MLDIVLKEQNKTFLCVSGHGHMLANQDFDTGKRYIRQMFFIIPEVRFSDAVLAEMTAVKFDAVGIDGNTYIIPEDMKKSWYLGYEDGKKVVAFGAYNDISEIESELHAISATEISAFEASDAGSGCVDILDSIAETMITAFEAMGKKGLYGCRFGKEFVKEGFRSIGGDKIAEKLKDDSSHIVDAVKNLRDEVQRIAEVAKESAGEGKAPGGVEQESEVEPASKQKESDNGAYFENPFLKVAEEIENASRALKEELEKEKNAGNNQAAESAPPPSKEAEEEGGKDADEFDKMIQKFLECMISMDRSNSGKDKKQMDK